MKRKIWWGLLVFVLLFLGIWFYTIGLRSRNLSKEKEVLQKKEAERAKVRKSTPSPKREVTIPSDYELISPEVEGIEGFEEERRQQEKLKDRGIPTG